MDKTKEKGEGGISWPRGLGSGWRCFHAAGPLQALQAVAQGCLHTCFPASSDVHNCTIANPGWDQEVTVDASLSATLQASSDLLVCPETLFCLHFQPALHIPVFPHIPVSPSPTWDALCPPLAPGSWWKWGLPQAMTHVCAIAEDTLTYHEGRQDISFRLESVPVNEFCSWGPSSCVRCGGSMLFMATELVPRLRANFFASNERNQL